MKSLKLLLHLGSGNSLSLRGKKAFLLMAPLQEGNGPVLQDDLWSKVLVRELGTEPFESPHQRFQQSPHQDYSERSRVGWPFAVGC